MTPEIALRRLRRLYDAMHQRWFASSRQRADFAAYEAWLKRHPDGTYSQFYVATIEPHLDGEGGPHSTLGPHPKWERRGDRVLRRLTKLGLQPGDLVVDYGCGTLREGIHLIRYLDKGRYVGLDIDERVLAAARRLAGPALLAEKNPHLAVATPAVITETAAAKPNWIVSSYVISQMPSDPLDTYLDNLGKLLEGGGKALLQMRLAWRTKQYAKTGWYHSRLRMAQRFGRRGLEVLELRTRPRVSELSRVRGVDARVIVCKVKSTAALASMRLIRSRFRSLSG
jgi:SAM-dependent methyltransferase